MILRKYLATKRAVRLRRGPGKRQRCRTSRLLHSPAALSPLRVPWRRTSVRPGAPSARSRRTCPLLRSGPKHRRRWPAQPGSLCIVRLLGPLKSWCLSSTESTSEHLQSHRDTNRPPTTLHLIPHAEGFPRSRTPHSITFYKSNVPSQKSRTRRAHDRPSSESQPRDRLPVADPRGGEHVEGGRPHPRPPDAHKP